MTPEISNLDFPVATTIRQALHQHNDVAQALLREQMSEDEFVSHRVDIYLQTLEIAMHAGLEEAGAKEIALLESLTGL